MHLLKSFWPSPSHHHHQQQQQQQQQQEEEEERRKREAAHGCCVHGTRTRKREHCRHGGKNRWGNGDSEDQEGGVVDEGPFTESFLRAKDKASKYLREDQDSMKQEREMER